jgi:ketopantoate reductase
MKFAVLGAGAVGCYFGGMLARAGRDVVLIARPPHVEAIHRHGLRMETRTFDEQVRLAASGDAGAVKDADVVLFCVKSTDTEATMAAGTSSSSLPAPAPRWRKRWSPPACRPRPRATCAARCGPSWC